MVIPSKLYRNIPVEYIKLFVEEGEVMFRPLSYYRSIEDPLRRDENEGIVRRNFYSGSVEFVDERAAIGKHTLQITRATLNLWTHRADEIYVSCFSTCPRSEPSGVTAEVFEPRLFLTKLKSFLKAVGITLFWGPIEYYDAENVEIDSAWEKARFMKSKSFEEEKEFRLAFVLEEDHRYRSQLDKLSMAQRMLKFQTKSLAEHVRLFT
jgi:hypothetical protein